MDHRVAVVGAGYAGMAAAVSLAERNFKVTVFESGPVPGGRARRITSQGTELDNGQHILVGAYSTLLGMMRTVGAPDDALLRVPLEIRYASGFHFRSLRLPGPLGLAGGLLAASGVSVAERLGALRFMAAIYRAVLEEIERDGFRVLTQRTSLTPLRKFWIAWKTWVSA